MRSSSKPTSAFDVLQFRVAGDTVYHSNATSIDEGTEKPQHRRGLLASWWLELLAVLGMVLSLLALFTTLGLHNGQPPPQWPIHITVNSLVSIYSVVFRTCLIFIVGESLAQMRWLWYHRSTPLRFLDRFDAASRGPIGSLKLIWATRRQLTRASVPVVAALIVVLALAVDPFVQQLTSNRQCTQKSDTNGTIYTVRWYDTSIGLPRTIAKTAIAGLSEIDLVDTRSQPLKTCAGNSSCNVNKPYWTLGVCSECLNVTSQLQSHCSSSGQSCNYTLPARGTDSGQEYPFGLYWDVRDGMSDDADWRNSTAQDSASGDNTIVDIRIFKNTQPGYAYPGISYADWDGPGKALGATQCRLRPCAQRLQPAKNFTNDQLVESLVDSVPLGAYDPTYTFTRADRYDSPTTNAIPEDCLDRGDSDYLHSKHFPYHQGSHTFHPPGNGSICNYTAGAQEDDRLERICSKCYFYMGDKALMGLGLIFSDSSPEGGTLTMNAPKDDPEANLGSLDYGNWTTSYTVLNGTNPGVGSMPGRESFDTPWSKQFLWKDGAATFATVSALFDNLARSLSVQIRNDVMNNVRTKPPSESVVETPDPSLPQRGPGGVRIVTEAYENDRCVQVAWGWIALPLVLFVASLLVFTIVLLESYGSVVQDWKSSSLPLVFHGLEESLRESSREVVDTAKSMELAADAMQVELRHGDEGLALMASGTDSAHRGQVI